MARKVLGTVDSVSTMAYTDSILVEIGGSIRRISLSDFTDAIQSNDLGIRLYAWGVPIKQDVQSSPDWGRVGNLDMWEAYKAQIGRYLLSSDGTKMAKLNVNDSSIYADGTTLDESKGNVMCYFPRLYYDLRDSSYESYPTLWMSTLPISNHYIDKQIVGAYMGSYDNSTLYSRSGVTPKVSQTITQFWTAAQKNGTEYGLTNYDFMRLAMMCCLSEYGSPDVQSKVGNGICGSVSVDWQTEANTLLTGATKNLGDYCGNIPITSVDYPTVTDASRVNFFGVEDLWGWVWHMIQGIYFGSSANSAQTDADVYIYEGNRLPSSTELTSQPTGSYRKITRLTTNNQYIKTMYLGEYFDLIAKTGGGSTSTYWCDEWFWSTTGQLCLVGGVVRWLYAGLGCVNSSGAWSGSSTSCGARLAYYGNPTIVNGAAM